MEKLSQKEMFVIRDHQSQFGISADDDRDYYFFDECLKLRDGQFELYYDNGNLLAKGTYEKGYRVGAWQYFYDDGSHWQRGFYKSDGSRFEYKNCEDSWEYF